ncbi:hypothetical protein MBLNU459_g6812t1 [Dothideomycetes sp. NU459]
MADELVASLLFDPHSTDANGLFSDAVYDANLRQLVHFVRATKGQDLVRPVNGSSLLELLDPTRNTISYLAVLTAQKELALKTRQTPPQLLNCTLSFLASFDPVQARYVGKELRGLLNWLALCYEQTGDASLIPAIGAAVLRLDPAGSTFTSTHLLFVQLCLLARRPRLALPVLDSDIYDFPADSPKHVDEQFPCTLHPVSSAFITKSSAISADLKPSDVQEYHLLGAQVYIGLRRFSRARLFLELVLASPTNHVATPLMLEAYKKLVLISLLTTGDKYSPKGTLGQQTHRAISAMSRPYEALADIFKNRDVQRFAAEVDAGASVWDEDANTSLVNEVAESVRRYRVIDLQKTYSALSVERIAVHLSLSAASTTALLGTMIRDGHIQATLPQTHDASPPVLRFLSHDPNSPTVGLDQDRILQAKYAQIDELSRHVYDAERKLAVTKEYIDFVRRNKRAEGAGAPGYEDPMEEVFDNIPGDPDEDMMSDMR